MKTVLYYFSGTGNSLQVARDLASELGDTKIISIPQAGDNEVSADRIGVVYPVYIFGLPLVVSRFLRKLRVSPEAYIFAVATFGGTAGGVVQQTERVLRNRGLRLAAGFLVTMPGNYTPLYGAISEERRQRMFDEEKKTVRHIAAIVREGTGRDVSRAMGVKNAILSWVYRMAAPRIPQMDKGFWSNEQCNGCGLCAGVCPVKNIGIVEGKPRWLHHCEQCLGCLHWCPQEAIQYKRSTIGRKRYRHPDVKAEDIIAGARG